MAKVTNLVPGRFQEDRQRVNRIAADASRRQLPDFNRSLELRIPPVQTTLTVPHQKSYVPTDFAYSADKAGSIFRVRPFDRRFAYFQYDSSLQGARVKILVW